MICKLGGSSRVLSKKEEEWENPTELEIHVNQSPYNRYI